MKCTDFSMESRVMGNYHARFGPGEKGEITPNPYLSALFKLFVYNIHAVVSEETQARSWQQFTVCATTEDWNINITNNSREETVLISVEDYHLYQDYLYERYAREKLAEAETVASQDDTWLDEEDF